LIEMINDETLSVGRKDHDRTVRQRDFLVFLLRPNDPRLGSFQVPDKDAESLSVQKNLCYCHAAFICRKRRSTDPRIMLCGEGKFLPKFSLGEIPQGQMVTRLAVVFRQGECSAWGQPSLVP